MSELPLSIIAALTLVALVAGFVDAIAGGGGLLTVPALGVLSGLPPHLIFGTNKGASVFGSFAALLRFWRAKLIDPRRARWLFPVGFVGSLLGAALQLALEPAVLRPLALVLLVGAAVLVALARLDARPSRPAPAHVVLKASLLACAIGAYDGFFGPGTGTLLIIAFATVLGMSLSEATANAKVVNFASNLAAVLLFVWKGTIVWRVALPMAVGQFLGGTLGAQFALTRGDRTIRWVVLAVVLALVAKLGYDTFR